jgi:hypothetical protein
VTDMQMQHVSTVLDKRPGIQDRSAIIPSLSSLVRSCREGGGGHMGVRLR